MAGAEDGLVLTVGAGLQDHDLDGWVVVDGVEMRHQRVQVFVGQAVALGGAAQGEGGQAAMAFECGGAFGHGHDVSQSQGRVGLVTQPGVSR